MQSTSHPMKGELYLVRFPDDRIHKRGMRPAVVVQSDFINSTAIQTTLVCPLTSLLRGLRSHLELLPSSVNGLKHTSAVVCEQVVVVDKEDLQKKIGQLTYEEMLELEDMLLLVFDIGRTL